MELVIHKETTARVPAKAIRALFERVAEGEAKPRWRARVNLVFINDRKMQRLNREYRGMNRPTDVLSFNLDSPESGEDIFGEVYISTDTAARQAKAYGGSRIEEYLRLACHGFLHLFGYDHQKKDDAAAMQTRERRYLGGLKDK